MTGASPAAHQGTCGTAPASFTRSTSGKSAPPIRIRRAPDNRHYVRSELQNFRRVVDADVRRSREDGLARRRLRLAESERHQLPVRGKFHDERFPIRVETVLFEVGALRQRNRVKTASQRPEFFDKFFHLGLSQRPVAGKFPSRIAGGALQHEGLAGRKCDFDSANRGRRQWVESGCRSGFHRLRVCRLEPDLRTPRVALEEPKRRHGREQHQCNSRFGIHVPTPGRWSDSN